MAAFHGPIGRLIDHRERFFDPSERPLMGVDSRTGEQKPLELPPRALTAFVRRHHGQRACVIYPNGGCAVVPVVLDDDFLGGLRRRFSAGGWDAWIEIYTLGHSLKTSVRL